MKSPLAKFKLYYERLDSEEAEYRIMQHTKSLKLKRVKTGWIAQVRVRRKIGGQLKRVEYSAIEHTYQAAINKLDSLLQELGVYDD